MNILFIHEVDWLRKPVFEIHTLPELLSLAGHNIYAIDYESMWNKEDILENLRTMVTTRTNVTRAYPEASVNLIRPGFIRIPVLSRISAFLTHYWVIRKTLMEKDIDIVMLYSVPTNGLQTLSLCKSFGIPLVFRSLDILYQLVPNRWLRWPTRCMEKAVYSGVDSILTITPALSRYVTDLGAHRGKVEVLPLGIDTNLFRPDINTTELRRRLRLQWELKDDDRVIVFIGTLPHFSGLDVFLSTFRDILSAVPNAKLLIVGDGPQRPKLQGIIDKIGMKEHVLITGLQPHATMPAYINLATVCLSSFPVSGATKDIFPTKIVQYMACGKPTVSTPLHGLGEMGIGAKQGILYADVDKMAPVIIPLLKANTDAEQLGQAALKHMRETHGYDKIVQRLETRLVELVNNRRYV